MNHLTIHDLAIRLGISDQRVRQLATARKIGMQLSDHTWIFHEGDVAKFDNRNTGRPKKKKEAKQ